ncbi:hypothetical protein [Vibrio genomosp. F10]|uniref:hypothetical protein n=1 Tax=Vibrio genomosp. F10 TaxID=723171 RepID=UPI00030C441E|nr:hypothetical protein [Vibrio genomosp. F10]OEF08799.1 hypothetical protein A1QI_15825 [Vibrio genomosp. F10 str. 9ZB36]
MSERTAVINYLFEEKFDSCIETLVDVTGYQQSQIKKWLSGETIPRTETIDYITMCIYTPEFKVVEEFYEIDSTEPIKTQLSQLFDGHEERAGVYAFYDSMASLLYVGKASNLLQETYSAIMREDEVKFPAGITNKMQKRFELVRYVSAYDVETNDHWDYPKHVESLILRISKPRLNKQIGILEQAYPENSE